MSLYSKRLYIFNKFDLMWVLLSMHFYNLTDPQTLLLIFYASLSFNYRIFSPEKTETHPSLLTVDLFEKYHSTSLWFLSIQFQDLTEKKKPKTLNSVGKKMVENLKNVQGLGVSMDVLPRNSSDLFDEDGRPKRTGTIILNFFYFSYQAPQLGYCKLGQKEL